MTSSEGDISYAYSLVLKKRAAAKMAALVIAATGIIQNIKEPRQPLRTGRATISNQILHCKACLEPVEQGWKILAPLGFLVCRS